MFENINYLFFIELFGSVGIIIGIFILSSKKGSNPKSRIKGFGICGFGCILITILGIMIGTYFVALANFIVAMCDIYGIHNCKKELRLFKYRVD